MEAEVSQEPALPARLLFWRLEPRTASSGHGTASPLELGTRRARLLLINEGSVAKRKPLF